MTVGRHCEKITRPQLIITLEHRIDSVLLTLVGEIDIASVAEMKATIDLIVANTSVTAMHVDAIHVTFIDSAGLRTLMQARQAAVARGLEFTLRTQPEGQVQRVITLSGLDDTLTDYSPAHN